MNDQLKSKAELIQELESLRKEAAELAPSIHQPFVESLIEQSPFSMQILDASGRTIKVNKAWEELWGISWQEFSKIGYNILEDEQLKKLELFPYLERAFAGEVVSVPAREYDAHGTLGTGLKRWVKANIYPVKDKSGNIQTINLVHEDISHQKRDEEKLRISDLRLKMLVKASGIVIWDWNIITNELYWDDAHYPTFGYSREDTLPTLESWTDFIHPDDVQQTLDSLYGVVESGETQWYAEYRFKNKDGSYSHTQDWGTVIHDTKGKPARMIGLMLDVTEQKESGLKLQKSESRFRSYFELGLIGMATTTIKKGWVDFNDTLCNMFGYSREVFAKLTWEELTHPEDITADLAQLDRVLNGEIDGYSLEKRFIHRDGGIIHAHISAQATRNDDGTVDHFTAFVLDISELKMAEEELLKARKLESVGLLAGGIAHDFNNILTGIFGNIQLAKMEIPADHAACSYMENANLSLERATQLTQQLLTFAKGGDPILERINIGPVIQESIKFSLSGSNVKTIINLPENLWQVKADKGQIFQVITNLVINADCAMPEGGTLTFKAENIMNVEGNLKYQLSGNVVKLSIKDEGSGISLEHQKQIFDPYFTTKKAGNGLGLATAHSIISKHDGHISVVSELGVGTTFTIYLPADKSTATITETTTSGPEDKSGSCGGHILLMDDDEMILDLSSEMIKSYGYTVDTSADGKEAIEKYISAKNSDNPYDLVIMDLTIPGGMGGKEALQKILAIDPEVKAIVSSGYSTDPIMAKFKEYDFKGRLVKPFQMEDLQKELARVIELG